MSTSSALICVRPLIAVARWLVAGGGPVSFRLQWQQQWMPIKAIMIGVIITAAIMLRMGKLLVVPGEFAIAIMIRRAPCFGKHAQA